MKKLVIAISERKPVVVALKMKERKG